MSGRAPITGKIVLKSTTSTSLNDRFTRVMVESARTKKRVSLNEASLKNQRLAEQMSKRNSPVVKSRPAPISPPKQLSLKSRLTAVSKSPKSRLGVVRPDGGGIVAAASPLMSQRISGRPWTRGSPVGRGQSYTQRPYVRGRGGVHGQRGLYASRGSARGTATFGRGRGGLSRGQGRGQFAPREGIAKSKDDLDKELDDYMVHSSKSQL